MNKSMSILVKVVIFGGLTLAGIIYVGNQSAVDNMGTYEKQEMVKPNKSRSVIDQLFSSGSKTKQISAESDAISLTGSSGRYEEVRIGKKSE